MYRTAEFRSVFANDWRFDESGNPIEPGARELAEAVVARLRPRVESVTDVEQHSFYGWGFEVRFCDRRFYNVINPAGEDCYLIVKLSMQRFWALLLRRPHDTFEQYCQALSDSLGEIPQVSEIAWEDYSR